MQTKQKGFTLIELLVVIAIIGILASAVLIGFPLVTNKAKDARVKSAVSQMKNIMAQAVDTYGNYDSFTTNTPEMLTLTSDLEKNTYDGIYHFIKAPLTGSNSACVYALLSEKAGSSWYCLDGAGNIGTTDIDPATTTADYCSDVADPVVCPPIDRD
ncbi:MAG: type II secretion system protein [Candidatus Gribaldobacteria bacterium]|nr:type II secretion system protein [Candidatus Gribaldobacteria bacterium]